jgi:hypothetical protein
MSAASPQEQELQKMDPFTMVTMLLRLATTLQHQNGDISMQKSTGVHTTRAPTMEPQKWDNRISFSTLDAFSAILTLDRGVVAACYELEEPLKVEIMVAARGDGLVVNPNQNTTIPLRNAQGNENSSVHNVRYITSGTDYWIKIKASDPLDIDPLGYLRCL